MTPTPSNCRTGCSTKGELKGLVDGRLSDDQTLARAIHDGAVKRLERRRVTCHRHDQSAFRTRLGDVDSPRWKPISRQLAVTAPLVSGT